MKKIELEWRGERKVGAVAQSGGTTWFSIDGEVWVHETQAARRRGGAGAAAGDPSVIVAPMPGKIVKVAAEVGAAVKAGDTVIVMEAMKMEYTLKAVSDAKVSEISCKAGEQVPLGTILAKLQVAESKKSDKK